MDQVRQGDVLLQEVADFSGKEVEAVNGKYVLAWGEVTGHHHRFLEGQVMMFQDDGLNGGSRVFVKPIGGHATLVHEEHEGVTILGRVYEQAFAFEYTPAELKRVAD